MSEASSCCGIAYPELDPPLFSFNSPLGMCPDCNGIGSLLSMDEDKIIPNRDLTIREGAVIPWQNIFKGKGKQQRLLGGWTTRGHGKSSGASISTRPGIELPQRQRHLILYGAPRRELTVNWNSEKIQGSFTTTYEGLLDTMMRRYLQTTSETPKKCIWPPSCPPGLRRPATAGASKPEVLNVKIGDTPSST
jgi:excinuclease ABC subunit A